MDFWKILELIDIFNIEDLKNKTFIINNKVYNYDENGILIEK